MGDLSKPNVRSWWSLLLRSAIASAATAALLENFRIDWLGENKLGKTAFSIHMVIYILRTLPWVLFTRLFNLPDRSSYLPLGDAVLVRLLSFSARAPTVMGTRPMMKFASNVGMAMCARRNPRVRYEKMHFGLSTAPYEALCITLDQHRSLGECVVVMAFHGGGYTTGECEMYCPMYVRLLEMLEKRGIVAAVLSVEYPLAPEYPYPAAVDFSENLFNELVVRRGLVDPHKVILLGDSAGGGLCFALSLRLTAVASEHLQVAGLVTICPWVTHEFETSKYVGDYIHAGVVRNASQMYLGEDTHHMHPEVSVSQHPSVHLLPPVLMIYGEHEMFADSIVSFADSLKKKACEVELVKGKDMPHVYVSVFPQFHLESSRAIDRIADFCEKKLHKNV